MQLYTENGKEIKNYSFIIDFWCQLVTIIALYKSCVYCKQKISLVRSSAYFREQYYAFRNQLRVLV